MYKSLIAFRRPAIAVMLLLCAVACRPTKQTKLWDNSKDIALMAWSVGYSAALGNVIAMFDNHNLNMDSLKIDAEKKFEKTFDSLRAIK